MDRLSLKHVGPPSTHQEIKRLRRQVGDMLRRYGQPVVYFKAWNLEDLANGLAVRCPACYDDTYGQSREDCEVCFNTTLVSAVDSADHYITEEGFLTTETTDIVAPAFGGFREPVLTRITQPDAGTDIFRLNEQGVLVRTQDATAVAYWYPTMGDNDIVVDVTLGVDQSTVIAAAARYQLKQVQPITIRGWGKRTHDQAYTVQQQFEMNTIPIENILHQIAIPVTYGVI